MTTFSIDVVSCWACGKTSTHHTLVSVTTFGPPDLDLRPAEMQRGTMSSWVQACTHCGNVSQAIEKEPANPDAARAAMAGDRWRELTAGEAMPALAAVFLRHALLERSQGRPLEAGEATIRAAWAADDAGDGLLAGNCRREAADLLLPLLVSPDLAADRRETLAVRLVDVLRRAGEWARAKKFCADLLAQASEGVIGEVLRLQASLVEQRDAGCHCIPQAPERGL